MAQKTQLLRLHIERSNLTKHPDTIETWTSLSTDVWYPDHDKDEYYNFITLKEVQAFIAKYARRTYDIHHRWIDGWKDQIKDVPWFTITRALERGETYSDFVNILPRWGYEQLDGKCIIGWETYIWEMGRYPRLHPDQFPKGMILSAGVKPSFR